MKKPKISIIVPVYNAEKYINECVDSIINQSFEEWELLLIDDGSTDNSSAICDNYADLDNRIIVHHKNNNGVSSARNVGLDSAKGDWCLFVDADDMIYDDTLSILYNEATSNDLDILQFSYNREYKKNDKRGNNSKVVDSVTYIKNGNYNVCIAGLFVNIDIIYKNHIRFNEKIHLGEDQLFVFDLIRNSNRIKQIGDVLYYYRVNDKSAVHNPKTKDIINSIIEFSKYKKDNQLATDKLDCISLNYLYSLTINTSYPMKELVQLYKMSKISHCRNNSKGAKFLYYFAKLNTNMAIIITRLLFAKNK